MNIDGANGFVPVIIAEEPGMGKLVNEEKFVFFDTSATIHIYTVDEQEIGFVHEESILGYLE